jgi:hypothetical protein
MSKFSQYFGFFKPEKVTAAYPDKYSFTGALDEKLVYLKALEADEIAGRQP